jgi:hypothetical protein
MKGRRKNVRIHRGRLLSQSSASAPVFIPPPPNVKDLIIKNTANDLIQIDTTTGFIQKELV